VPSYIKKLETKLAKILTPLLANLAIIIIKVKYRNQEFSLA
jgi:hypothetical protein